MVGKEDVLARSTPAHNSGHMSHCIRRQVTEKAWAGSTVRCYLKACPLPPTNDPFPPEGSQPKQLYLLRTKSLHIKPVEDISQVNHNKSYF